VCTFVFALPGLPPQIPGSRCRVPGPGWQFLMLDSCHTHPKRFTKYSGWRRLALPRSIARRIGSAISPPGPAGSARGCRPGLVEARPGSPSRGSGRQSRPSPSAHHGIPGQSRPGPAVRRPGPVEAWPGGAVPGQSWSGPASPSRARGGRGRA
jgi:hypothetical protein